MFGWLKLLCRKFTRLHPIVQLVVVVLLFIAARWTYRTVLYSSFTGRYLEGFGNGSTLTYFHMEGCPHCVKFTPEWDKFAQEYDGSLQIKKVEAKENRLIMFDGDQIHTGTCATDVSHRIVINSNFVTAEKFAERYE